MQKVLYLSQLDDIKNYIEEELIDYISKGEIHTFESFKNFDFIAFDWYDIYNLDAEPTQMMIYIDKDDVFFLCETEKSAEKARKLFKEEETNELALYTFIRNLIIDDSKHIESLETQLTAIEEDIINCKKESYVAEITDYRREILRLKGYYEQLLMIFDDIMANDNCLFSPESLRFFTILNNRIERILSNVINLQEYVKQIREAYQSQIDIEQNNMMKIFTVVTSIFLPLTLIAGWYGMNLQMPEFGWKYGYLLVIGISILACVVWYMIMKWKKWF